MNNTVTKDVLRQPYQLNGTNNQLLVNENCTVLTVNGVNNHVMIGTNKGLVVLHGINNTVEILVRNSRGKVQKHGINNSVVYHESESQPSRRSRLEGSNQRGSANRTGNGRATNTTQRSEEESQVRPGQSTRGRRGRGGTLQQGNRPPEARGVNIQNSDANEDGRGRLRGRRAPRGNGGQGVSQTIQMGSNIRIQGNMAGTNIHVEYGDYFSDECWDSSSDSEQSDQSDEEAMFMYEDEDDDSGDSGQGEYLSEEEAQPVQVMKVKRHHKSIEDTCVICHEAFNRNSEQACFLECHHWFHFGCVTEWLRKKNKCPQCMTEVEVLFHTCK
jgi:hypothetical protein